MLKNWLSEIARSQFSSVGRRRSKSSSHPVSGFRSSGKRQRAARPALGESLEDRLLLTTFVVNTTEDGSLVSDGMLSLREAVIAANTNAAYLDAAAGEDGPGVVDTITFDASLNGQTITLSGLELTISDDLMISDSNATPMTIDAAGSSRVFSIADGAGNVSVGDVTITGGMAVSGAGIYVDDGENLQLSSATVSGNTATGDAATEGGGGIHNAGGTVNISGGLISGNSAVGTSGSGGGILTTGGVVTVSNATISGNVANRAGGGIEDNSGAGLGLTLTNVVLSDNVTGPAGAAAPGNGGGLHVTGPGDVNIVGGTVSGNFAAAEGGGLWNGTGTMTISGGTLISDNSVAGNSADQGGGGIFNAGGTVDIDGATISGNNASAATTVTLDGSQEVPAVTTSVTGALGFQYNVIDNTFELNLRVAGLELADMTAAPELTGAHLHLGEAGTNGPVIVNLQDFGSFEQIGDTIQLALNDVPFPVEHVDALFDEGVYVNVHSSANAGGEVRGQIAFPMTMGSGGGILNDGGTLTVQNTTISDNLASRAGGGIESNVGTTSLTNVNLIDNFAGLNNAATPGNGGGLHITGAGDATISGGSVVGNVAAAEGGGLWNGSGTMTVTDVVITGNGAFGFDSDQGGGGIFNAGGTVNVTDGVIENNSTVGATVVPLSGSQEVPVVTTNSNGLVEFHYNHGTNTFRLNLFISDLELTDSTALPELTGAHIHAAAIGANGPVIVNLQDFGSFVQESNGIRLILEDVPFPEENVTDLLGGGTYINVHSSDNAGGEVRGQLEFPNTAASGGGVLNDRGVFTADGTSISGNTAARAGGGIETVGGQVTLDEVTLDNNIAGPENAAAPGNGGGLHTSGAGIVTINAGTVSGNLAGSEGGGLWNSSTGTLTVDGTTIDGNSAATGGGVFNDAADGTATQEFTFDFTELNSSGVTGSGTVTVTQPTETTREVRVVLNATGMEDLSGFGGFHVAHIHGQFAGNRTRPILEQGDGPFFDGAGGIANSYPPVNSILPSVAANDGVTIEDGFLDFLEGRPEYGPVVLNLTSTQMRDAGSHGTNPPDGVPPLTHFLNLFTNGDIDPAALYPSGTDFNLDTTYTFDLTNPDEARQFNNLAPLELREIVLHGASIDKAISDAIDAAAQGTAPAGTDLGNGQAFRVTAPIAAAEIVAVSGSTTIRNATISNNSASGDGGGLLNESGAVTIIDSDITGNVSGGDEPGEGGGGVFNHGTLEISGGSVSGNTATVGLGNGGGIHNAASGTLTVSGTTISGNETARAGGGIESAGTVELTDVELTDNFAGINGGGLHVSGPGTTAISGGTVSGNLAAAEGGGLWNGTGLMSITGGTVIINNGAAGSGADQGGGGVFNAGGVVDISEAVIRDNVASGGATFSLGGDQEVPAVTTSASGDAVFLYNSIADTFDLRLFVTGLELNDTTALPELTAAHIHLADAGENGPVIVDLLADSSFEEVDGGLLLNLRDVFISPQHAAALLTNGAYINVHSSANASGEIRGQITFPATQGSGGGILNDQGTLTVTDSTISGNIASRAGGGIESNVGNTILTNVTLAGNFAGVPSSSTPGNGGGLHITGAGDAEIAGGSVTGNFAAAEGGGLWNGSGTMLVWQDAVVSNNGAYGVAADQGGGGIFNAGGTLNIEQATVTGNSTIGATAISLTGDQEVPAVSTEVAGEADFSFNPRTGLFDLNLFVSGLELADLTAAPELTGAHIHLGEAGTNGPVIVNLQDSAAFVSEGDGIRLIVTDVAVPFVNYGDILAGRTYINVHSSANAGGEVRGQLMFPTTSSSGGGILNDGGTVTVSDATISQNSTARAGGGIETVGGMIDLTETDLNNNVAGPFGLATPGNGGGLHTTGDGIVSIIGGNVANNTAASEGGGLWNSAAGEMAVSGGTSVRLNFAGGEASDQGGGGIFNDGGVLTVSDSAIERNDASVGAGSGGGIFNNGGTVSIVDGGIYQNSASRAGGGIETLGGTLTITESTLFFNDAGANPGNGGALHITGDAIATIHNATVEFNTAFNEGAGLWNSSTGTLTVRNSTLLYNATDSLDGGGGIFTVDGGTTTLVNSIVADNRDDYEGARDPDDIRGAALAGGSTNNIIGDSASSGGLTNGANGNIVGDGGSGVLDIGTVLDGTPIVTNGHRAYPLITGSPAVDAGIDLSGVGVTTDIFGTLRPQASAFDIGAFELDANTAAGLEFTVTAGPVVQEGADLVFTVTANIDPLETVTINFQALSGTAVEGDDFTATSQTLTFTPGGGLSQTVNVPTIDDSIGEDQETVIGQISTPSAGSIAQDSALGYIVDADAQGRPVLDAIATYPETDQPTLAWSAVAGVDGYEVWLARIFPAQSRIQIANSDVTATAFTPDTLAPGYYRYWVRTTSDSSGNGPWSESNTFEIRPTLVSPLIPQIGLRPTFTWEEIPLTSGYELFVRTVNGDIVIDDIQSTSYTLQQDLPNGSVRWWIRSSDATGNRGWSEVGTFDIRTEVLAPTQATTGQPPTFSWRESQNAGRYVLVVQNTGTNEEVIREEQLTTTSYTPASPLPAGNYRAWVKAIDASTNSFAAAFWSRPFDFSVTVTQTDSEEADAIDPSVLIASLAPFRDSEAFSELSSEHPVGNTSPYAARLHDEHRLEVGGDTVRDPDHADRHQISAKESLADEMIDRIMGSSDGLQDLLFS